jgi:hypothetical protein
VLTDWYSCSSISRWRSVLGRHLALTYVLQLELLNTLCNGVRVTGGTTSNENSKCDRALLLHHTLLRGYQIFRLCLRKICNPFLRVMSAGREVVRPCKVRASNFWRGKSSAQSPWLPLARQSRPGTILGTDRSCLALAISQLAFDRYANIAIDRD